MDLKKKIKGIFVMWNYYSSSGNRENTGEPAKKHIHASTVKPGKILELLLKGRILCSWHGSIQFVQQQILKINSFILKHDILMVIAFSTNDQKQLCDFKFCFCMKTIKLCVGFAYLGISEHRRFFYEWLLVQIKGQ